MRTIGILGAGQVGSTLGRAAIGAGYDIVIANSRAPETLKDLVGELGPRAAAARATDAAASADFVIVAYPYAPTDVLPVDELAGKVVLDTNNYMAWRDGNCPEIDAGLTTVHELRQDQLSGSLVAKAFSHVQFHARSPIRDANDTLPGLVRLARPRGAPDRKALVVSSNYTQAVELVAHFYDELGFDAVDNSPLSESWRSAPGTPMWSRSVDGLNTAELVLALQQADRTSD